MQLRYLGAAITLISVLCSGAIQAQEFRLASYESWPVLAHVGDTQNTSVLAETESTASIADNGSCCQCCCDCAECGPCWIIRGGAIFLHRSAPAAFPLVTTATIGTPTLIDAADFTFGYQSGFDLSAIRQLNDCCGVDVRYFQVDSWNETIGPVTTTSSLVRFQNSSNSSVFNIPHPVSATYDSLLRSAEFNVRRQAGDWLTLLVGFRYINLEESLGANQGTFFSHRVETQNNLYGGQVGAEGLLWSNGCLKFDAWSKAGLYGNDAHASYSFRFPAIPIANIDANTQQTHVAFAGEVGLAGTLQLTDHISLRGGYQLLWLDRLALATEQFGVSSIPSKMGIDTTGNVFYHGAIASLEISW